MKTNLFFKFFFNLTILFSRQYSSSFTNIKTAEWWSTVSATHNKWEPQHRQIKLNLKLHFKSCCEGDLNRDFFNLTKTNATDVCDPSEIRRAKMVQPRLQTLGINTLNANLACFPALRLLRPSFWMIASNHFCSETPQRISPKVNFKSVQNLSLNYCCWINPSTCWVSRGKMKLTHFNSLYVCC